ncbi:MAG TPA: hypothetical protein PLH98_16425 [Ruminococcus flavefaciens]|nr:hypothetical protein [Ruminococcus flavefaciens]
MTIKSWLVGKLTGNAALMAAIGGSTHLLPQHPGTIAVFPCLIYTEANNADAGYFDNVATAANSVFTFDIYVNSGSTSTIAEALHTVMAGIFYSCEFSADVPDADLNVKHKTCRYRRAIRAEDLI